MKSLLSAVYITKSYGSGVTRVDTLEMVNFALFPSELVVLQGASGSGESTLLNIMGGPDSPAALWKGFP